MDGVAAFCRTLQRRCFRKVSWWGAKASTLSKNALLVAANTRLTRAAAAAMRCSPGLQRERRNDRRCEMRAKADRDTRVVRAVNVADMHRKGCLFVLLCLRRVQTAG